jgi:hypothetical protein
MLSLFPPYKIETQLRPILRLGFTESGGNQKLHAKTVFVK